MKNKIDSVVLSGYIMLGLALIITILGYYCTHETFSLVELVKDFYANFATEMASVAITIIIIDRLLRHREYQENEAEIKARLLRDVHSPVNDVANAAVHELRARGRLRNED